MTSGESSVPSESSGYRPPGELGAQGQPYQAPGQPYPPPGEPYHGQGYQVPTGGYQAPGPGYQAPGQGYPAAGAPGGFGGGYGAGGYGPGGGPGQANAAPLTPQEERTWAMAAHLSSILGVWVFFLGAVGPLVVMLTQGPRSPYVRAQSVEALNFNISVLIYSVIAWILVIVLIGFLALGALFVFQIVFTIIAAVKTSNGEPYRYPFTIRLVS
jgi:uncharacterized Tic20 family protein